MKIQVANGAVKFADMANEADVTEIDVYYARVAPFQLLSPPSE